MLTVRAIIEHRLATEDWVEPSPVARLPSAFAPAGMEAQAFRSRIDGAEHLALIKRPFGAAPLVRLHSECLTGDALGSLRCDCGEQLRLSLRQIAEAPDGGAVIYLRGQEGRGVGLFEKMRAYALQDTGLDTVEANLALGLPVDGRDYAVAGPILRALGLTRVRLLTNNPRKLEALQRLGVEVVERTPLLATPNPHNHAYLTAKRGRLGHDLPSLAPEPEPVR